MESQLAPSSTEEPEEPEEVDYYPYRQVYFNNSEYYNYDLPPATCGLCNCTFTDVPELEEHMLQLHAIDTKSPTSMGYKRNFKYLEHAVQNVMTIRAPPPERGYATIQARLFKNQEDNAHSICVDTGSTATFIDAELVPKDVIVQKTRPITVKGVSGQKVVDHCVDLPLHISGSDGQVTMHTRACVATGIQAGVLLGMDELSKEEDDIAL